MFAFLMRIRSLVLVFILTTPAGSRLWADPVDDYVQSVIQKEQVPGVGLAVTRGGTVVKVAGYGLANVENQVPVTPQTVFQIQSVTKQFVATAIMMLVEE